MVSLSRTMRGLRVAAGDTLTERRRPYPDPDDASPRDLYLAPHFDDICFSLGALAARRRQGMLLTLFSNSNYVAGQASPRDRPAGTQAVSTLRRAEDAAFAGAVGLRPLVGGLDEASLRGRHPFDIQKAAADAILFDQPVLEAIRGAGPRVDGTARPWLYCPMGIGGHIDHVAVLRIVLRHYDALRASYRIAFYEDLHYASVWPVRVAGLLRFHRLVAPLRPRRSRYPIGAVREKVALAALYRSQFDSAPTTIAPFTPAQWSAMPAHEAIWTAEGPAAAV